MALLCDNAAVIAGAADFPIAGVWFADLELDADSAPKGRVSIALEGADFALSGTVVRSGDFGGRVRVRVVGGAGGFGRLLGPASYRGVTVRLPILDALRGGAEALAASSSASILGRTLPIWTRIGGSVGATLDRIVARISGAAWRTVRSGDVWIGTPSFVPSKTDLEILAEDGELGRFTFVTDDMRLQPDMSFEGRKITGVRYSFAEDAIRGTAWYQP